MPCYAIDGLVPVVDPSAHVHPTAVLIGDVWIGPGVYIGPCASLRGDFGRIVVEDGANIQDTCVLHGFPDRDMLVEADGHIGHGAVLHGCVVRRNALVGINAVVNDNAEVGESSIVAAMTFVKAQFVVPPARRRADCRPICERSPMRQAERDATRRYQLAVRAWLACTRPFSCLSTGRSATPQRTCAAILVQRLENRADRTALDQE